MQNILLSCLFIAIAITLKAQDKKPAKRETIDYLNKKLKETVGHYRTPSGLTSPIHYWDAYFMDKGDKVLYFVRASNLREGTETGNCDFVRRDIVVEYNPAHIISIVDSSVRKDDPVGIIIIKLISKTAIANQKVFMYKKQRNDGSCFDEWLKNDLGDSLVEVGFLFLQSDSSNFLKIKKALEHLRDLYKAEDDLFGN